MTDNNTGARFSRLVGTLKLPSFKKVIILIVTEVAIYWLGNPIIYDGLAWHHIPESGAALFLGIWMKEAGFRWWFIPVVFFATLVPLIMIWSAPECLIVAIALSIGTAIVSIGYYVGKPKPES